MFKFINKINIFIIILSILTCIIYAINYFHKEDYIMVFLSIITILLPLLIFIIDKLLKRQILDFIKFIFLIFIFVSAILGGIVNLYGSIYFYDKIIHFLSGVLIIWVLAIPIMKYFKNKNYNIVLYATSLTCINIAIAALWEIGEFIFQFIFHKQLQKGLDDTMIDMIVAIIGGIIITLTYAFNLKKNLNNIGGE